MAGSIAEQDRSALFTKKKAEYQPLSFTKMQANTTVSIQSSAAATTVLALPKLYQDEGLRGAWHPSTSNFMVTAVPLKPKVLEGTVLPHQSGS